MLMPQKPFECGLKGSRSCCLVLTAGLAAGRVSERAGKGRAGTAGRERQGRDCGEPGLPGRHGGRAGQVTGGEDQARSCTAGIGQQQITLSAEGRRRALGAHSCCCAHR